LFTILAGAKRHHLEPWAYLRDVLLRLSAGETDLESLLPDRWAAGHPEHVLGHRLDEARGEAAAAEGGRGAPRAEGRARAGETGGGGGWRAMGRRGLGVGRGSVRHRAARPPAPRGWGG